MSPKLVIFDFDGVIVNTEDIFFHNLHNSLKTFDIDISFKDTYKIFAGNDTYTTLKKVITQHKPNLDPETVFNHLMHNSNNWINNVIKTPHIGDLLNNLKIPFCIASNSSIDHITTTLKSINLDHFFSLKTIFSAYALGSFKPEPTVYLEALKNMGVKASDAIAIEDSIPGLTAAISAGIPTIGFVGSIHVNFDEHSELLYKHGAFVTISSFKEVLKILT